MSSFLLIGAVLIALPGFKRRSKPVQIPDLPAMEESADYTETKQGITLQAKRLNKSEAELILGKRAGRLWHQTRLRKTKRRKKQRACGSRKTKQIIPIQLSIKNQTDRTVTIGAQDINLKLTDGNTVAKRLRRRPFFAALTTAMTGIAILAFLAATTNGLGSLAFLGCCGAGTGKISALLASAVYGGAVLCMYGSVFTVLATPVVTTNKAMRTTTENRRVKKTVTKHNFATIIRVAPDQSIDTLIFVAEDDYKETFDINVQNENSSHYVPFNVKMRDIESPFNEKK